MKQIIEELSSQLQKFEKLNTEANLQLKQAPDGTLEISKKKDVLHFYKYTQKKRVYLQSTNKELQLLTQKRFNLFLVKNLKNKISILRKCIKLLTKLNSLTTISQLYNQLPNEIKTYITPLYNSDEAYAKRWQSKNYNHKENDSDSYVSQRGELVRSKTELIIADKLHKANIPYHYEIEMEVDFFHSIYPDFYILNKRTRKAYIWEHFGKMDDPLYCKKALLKLETYALKGYELGKNLILTFESSQYHINTNHLDKIIDTYFK